MTNPTIRINNGTEIIDREMTAGEVEQREADRIAWVARKAADEAEAAKAATYKAALLAKLGITADEAKLLLS